MTKLEAVQQIGRRILAYQIAALDTDGNGAAADIEREVDNQNLYLQSRGWSFNTYHETVLTPDGSGNIVFDDNTIKQWPDPNDVDYCRNLQRHGTQLYDMDNQTFVFDGTVTMTLVKLIAFDCCPELFRQWIACEAACRYNEQRGFNQKQPTLDREALKAKVEWERYEQRVRHTTSLQTPAAAAIRGYRYRYGTAPFSSGGGWG